MAYTYVYVIELSRKNPKSNEKVEKVIDKKHLCVYD